MTENKKPAYRLGLRDPESGATDIVGAVWEGEAGRLYLRLNIGTTLSGLDQRTLGLQLTLFPLED